MQTETAKNWNKRFKMTERRFMSASEMFEGRCIACGAAADGCEPDAREYGCESCGEQAVYGLEELLMMGRIVIV